MRTREKQTSSLKEGASKSKTGRVNTPTKGRKPKPKVQTKRPFPFFYALIGATIVLFLGLGVKFYWDSSYRNPLIGTWRAQTSLGILEVTFEPHSRLFFGTKTAVSYEIGEKQVIVFDKEINIGQTYTIIDHNKIMTQTGGYKTLYQRVP